MSNELERDSAQESIDHKKRLQQFMQIVHKSPAKGDVQTNSHANNTQYLPISYIEMQLDELFFGLWETKDFKWQTVANEIIGSITLRVFHPVANHWIERTGAAATMIRQQGGADLTDVSKKIKNALEMDFPHLKADCTVNAARSLGKSFGRDLNRKFWDAYNPLIQQEASGIEAQSETPEMKQETDIRKQVEKINTNEVLSVRYHEILKEIAVDDKMPLNIHNIFSDRRRAINAAK